jgi:hypothetical protein
MPHLFSHTFFNIVSPFYPPFVTLEDLIFNLKVMYILNHKLFENRFNIWVPAEESFKTIPILNTFLRYLKINFWNIAKLSKISWNLAKIYFETICYPTFQTWFIRVAKDSIFVQFSNQMDGSRMHGTWRAHYRYAFDNCGATICSAPFQTWFVKAEK